MKLVTIFVLCDITASPLHIKEHLGETIARTIEDPQVVHDRKNLEKVVYWKDMEFSDNYSIDKLINELTSEFPQYIVFDVTRPKPKFHEKNGWWLGLISTIAIGAIFALWGFLQQNGW